MSQFFHSSSGFRDGHWHPKMSSRWGVPQLHLQFPGPCAIFSQPDNQTHHHPLGPLIRVLFLYPSSSPVVSGLLRLAEPRSMGALDGNQLLVGSMREFRGATATKHFRTTLVRTPTAPASSRDRDFPAGPNPVRLARFFSCAEEGVVAEARFSRRLRKSWSWFLSCVEASSC